MSRRANPTLIGAFVVGALAIAFAIALILARGALFAQHPRAVLFFEGSVYGLQIGAPVNFRGVQVGKVLDISIEYLPTEQAFFIPVRIELEPERIRLPGTQGLITDTGVTLRTLVERGLRAKLQMQSFVTGQLFIELDLMPGEPARLLTADPGMNEIPTVTTAIERLIKRLEDFPLDKALESISGGIEGLNRLVNAPALTESLAQLNKTLRDFSALSHSLDAGVGRLLQRADSLVDDLRKTVKAVEQGMTVAEKAFIQYRELARDDSYTMQNFNATLEEIAQAARGLRQLADAIERNPESFLRGKSKP